MENEQLQQNDNLDNAQVQEENHADETLNESEQPSEVQENAQESQSDTSAPEKASAEQNSNDAENEDVSKSVAKRIRKLNTRHQAEMNAMRAELLAERSAAAEVGNADQDGDEPLTRAKLDAYLRERDHKIQAAQQAKQEQVRVMAFADRLEQARTLDSEFDELVEQDTSFNAPMVQGVLDAGIKNEKAFLKHLLKTQATELQKISQLPPLQQYRRIAELATEFKVKGSPRVAPTAPPPLNESTGNQRLGTSDPAKMTDAQLLKHLHGD